MERSRRRRASCIVALAAAVLVPSSSGGFSVSSTATPSLSTTLDGTDQTASYTANLTVDNSAIGITLLGWNLTITSTQLSTGGGTPHTLSTSASSITSVAVVCAAAPCLNPTNSVSYPLTLPAGPTAPAAVKLFNAAAATGTGTFTITPTVKVAIPANAYAGSYTSTLTLTLVSGP